MILMNNTFLLQNLLALTTIYHLFYFWSNYLLIY